MAPPSQTTFDRPAPPRPVPAPFSSLSVPVSQQPTQLAQSPSQQPVGADFARTAVYGVIEGQITQRVKHHARNTAYFTISDIDLPVYVTTLADMFYAQQKGRSGTVTLSESVLAELISFVDQSVEMRCSRPTFTQRHGPW
jgi:hypothetical protein